MVVEATVSNGARTEKRLRAVSVDGSQDTFQKMGQQKNEGEPIILIYL